MSESKNYIFNKSKDGLKANILIDGEISAWWGVGLKSLATDIATSGANEIMMQINSGGGSVFEGMAISAFIKSNPVQISTSILGLCASIATPIALSGKTTSIAKGSLFMIHNASGGTFGESKDHEDTAALLKVIDSQLIKIYVDAIEANGKLINDSRDETEKQVEKWQNNETWFTAEEAVEHGFIQTLTEGVEFVNKAQARDIYNVCSKYKNVPTNFLNRVKTIADMAEPTNNEAEKLGIIETVKAWFKSSPAEAQNLIKDMQKNEDEEKAAQLEAAIAIAKEQGFYKDPNSDKVEKEDSDLQAKLDETKEALELAEAKAQKLEEEKNGSPSAAANSNATNISDKEKQFNDLIASQLDGANAMAKEIFG